MRRYVVTVGLCALIAVAPILAEAQASATGAVWVSESLSLWLTGLALLGGSFVPRGR
jgi:hypothetical protein